MPHCKPKRDGTYPCTWRRCPDTLKCRAYGDPVTHRWYQPRRDLEDTSG